MSKRNLGKQAAAALKYNPDLNYAPVVVASGNGQHAFFFYKRKIPSSSR